MRGAPILTQNKSSLELHTSCCLTCGACCWPIAVCCCCRCCCCWGPAPAPSMGFAGSLVCGLSVPAWLAAGQGRLELLTWCCWWRCLQRWAPASCWPLVARERRCCAGSILLSCRLVRCAARRVSRRASLRAHNYKLKTLPRCGEARLCAVVVAPAARRLTRSLVGAR